MPLVSWIRRACRGHPYDFLVHNNLVDLKQRTYSSTAVLNQSKIVSMPCLLTHYITLANGIITALPDDESANTNYSTGES